MFKQSIDSRGGFPPRSGKPKKSKKKQPIKRRKKTRDPFSRERQQEKAFKFGEVRSGLSGRSIYNPADLIRFHQTAQFNQQRDEAEKSRRGGTFTGTSIGEEAKVREAQEVDKRFKERQLGVQERFAGALEGFVRNQSRPQPQPQQQEVLQELRNIRREVQRRPPPTTTTSIPTLNLSRGSSLGEADIEDITTPIPERRKPEDDITFLSSDRSRRTNYETPTSGRPRPDKNKPSLTTSIPSQDKLEQSSLLASFERQSRQPQVELSPAEQEEIRYKIYDAIMKGQSAPQPQPTLEIEDSPLEKTESQKDRRKLFLEEAGADESTPFLTPQGESPTPQEGAEPEPEPEPIPQEEPLIEFVGSASYDKLKGDSGRFTTGNNREGFTPTQYSFVDIKGQIGRKVKGQKYFVMGVKGNNYEIVADTQPNLSGWNSVAKSKLDKLVKSQEIDFIEK